jgi:hypothetical protein
MEAARLVCAMVCTEHGFEFACKGVCKNTCEKEICKYGIVMLYFVDGCTQKLSDEYEDCTSDVNHHIVSHMYFVVIL